MDAGVEARLSALEHKVDGIIDVVRILAYPEQGAFTWGKCIGCNDPVPMWTDEDKKKPQCTGCFLDGVSRAS